MGLSMDIFKELKKLYNDAGVSIYAVKDVRMGTDEDLEYTFTVAKTLAIEAASPVFTSASKGESGPLPIPESSRLSSAMRAWPCCASELARGFPN